MDLGGVPDLTQRDHAEPGTARARLSQALGPSPSLCPEAWGAGGFKKSLPATLETIRASLPNDTPLVLLSHEAGHLEAGPSRRKRLVFQHEARRCPSTRVVKRG